MRLSVTAILLLLLCLATGCTPPQTQPTEQAKQQGVVDPGVTFFDYPALHDGVGSIDDGASREFQTTESGLQYRILRASDGETPSLLDTVTVQYRGWLDDGTVFDASYDSRPLTIPLRNVVRGWQEGMKLIGVGGMIELWIPASLGYGERGMGRAVPSNAALHFVVELQSIQ